MRSWTSARGNVRAGSARRIVRSWPRLAAILVISALGGAFPAAAQLAGPVPPELQGIGITEHLGAQLPLDLQFVDEQNRPVRLSEFAGRGRPTILALVYYECPMLCTLVINGLVDGLREVPATAGKEFDVVAVSFNPAETAALARAKKEGYLGVYGRPGSEGGWHFLTGQEPQIRALAGAVGFGYRWIPERREFAHSAAIYVIDPRGRIVRYLYGVEFPARTLRLSLAEAGQGKIGTALDHVQLFCFHYDPAAGRYTLAAMNLMRAGGILVALVFGIFLAGLWLRERRRRITPPRAAELTR